MIILFLFLTFIGIIRTKFVEPIHAKISAYEGITDQKCGYSCNKLNYLNKCFGSLKQKSPQLSEKLMGADNALEGEFPWVVSLQSNKTKRHFCSGTIINKIWIITAAHCFNGNKKLDTFYIRTGSNKINSGNIETPIKYYIHPKYNLSDPSGPYDLALVVINKKSNRFLVKNKNNLNLINGICLPEKNIENKGKENAFYSGFGRIHYKGVRAKSLMKSVMTLLPNNECFSHISKYSMACVNSTTSSTCKGDSGSPLIQYVNNRAVLIGIHKGSTRIRGKCGRQTAVTTRVSKFIDWIVDTIRSHQNIL